MTEKSKLERCMEITEEALEKSKAIDEEGKKLMEFINNYYKDAKYYKSKGEKETALEAISYAHGILDAGVLLKHIKTSNYILNPEKKEK